MLKNTVSNLITFSVIILFFVQPAQSQTQNSKDQAILELLSVMKTMENMETSLNTMQNSIKLNTPYILKEIKAILARDLEEKDVQKAVEKYQKDDFGAKRLYELFRYKFNLERIKKEVMLPIYREHYSESEIRQLIDFYKSDLGQKTLKIFADISRSISTQTMDLSQMALSQAKEELAYELKKGVTEK